MLRGIQKTIETGPKTVRYRFTRADLIKRLRLPDDATLMVDGLIIGHDQPSERVLTVEFIARPRAAKAAA